MFQVLRLLQNELRKAEVSFYRDVRISSFPLVGSPWPMFTAIILYLLTIKKWGPQFMANRKAYNVKLPMQIYNVFQILLNAWIFIFSLKRTYFKTFNVYCQPYDPQDISGDMLILRYPAYAYYISKYLDLLDTIFFLLRKNNRQITFLHVYHHAIMVFAGWTYCTLLFASHLTMTGIVNSFVHVLMYSYYFVAALKLPIDLTPWKRRVTQLQILQFCWLTIHLTFPILNNSCGADMFWISIAFVQNFFILMLFCDFYYKAYVVKARSATVKDATSSNHLRNVKASKVH